MSINRIIGLVLIAVGVVLLVFGYNASQSVGERIVEGFTGRFTDQTMWFIIGGIAAIVGGAALSLWGGGRARAKSTAFRKWKVLIDERNWYLRQHRPNSHA